MVELVSLWLPILLSAVAVFVVSSIIHMALGYHAADWGKVPAEDAVLDAMRGFKIPRGDFMLPWPTSPAEARSPAFIEKRNRGPVIAMTVFPAGPSSMGKSLVLWFVYTIVVSVFAGYVAAITLPPGAPYLSAFRIAGTVAFAGYALALWQDSIWYGKSWGTAARSTIDGLIYALFTGGVFGWLWPR